MTDLICNGKLELKIGSGSYVDVSEETLLTTIGATVAKKDVPATFGSSAGATPGAVKYKIDIEYLATDGTDGLLFPLLFQAVLSSTREVQFRVALSDDVGSPVWTGAFVVPSVELGGQVDDLSQGKFSAGMTGAPTKA